MKIRIKISLRSLAAVLLAVGALCLSSCVKEEIVPMPGTGTQPDGLICFSLRSKSFKAFEGFNELGGPDTKANSATVTTIPEIYSEGIGVRACHAGAEDDYFKSGELLLPAGGASWTTSSQYYWPEDATETFDFWAWAPKDLDKTIDNSNHTLTFQHSVPANVTDQKDYILSFSGSKSKNSGAVAFNFCHPFAEVLVVVTKCNAGTVNSVDFLNIADSGTCTYSPESNQQVISWSALGEQTESVGCNFEETMQEDLMGVNPQQITSEDDCTVFMMVPQSLSGSQIKVVFHRTGEPEPSSYTVDLDGSWEPGMTYRYVLTLLDGLDISVSASATENVASNAVFANNGNSSCFIRAAIVANWQDSQGNILGSCATPIEDFDLSVDWSDWWVYDSQSDAYYYKKQVPAYGNTYEHPLFESYTLECEAPSSGAELHMDVLVQAIKAESDKSSAIASWGIDASSFVNFVE